jgi:hypothetical protein
VKLTFSAFVPTVPSAASASVELTAAQPLASVSKLPFGSRLVDDGGGGGAGDEGRQRYLQEVEGYERRDARRYGLYRGKVGDHGQPRSPEHVDDGEACASPQEASEQGPKTGGRRDGVGGEAGHSGGQGVGDQVSPRGPQNLAETAREVAEHGHADRAHEHVNGLGKRPHASPEQ